MAADCLPKGFIGSRALSFDSRAHAVVVLWPVAHFKMTAATGTLAAGCRFLVVHAVSLQNLRELSCTVCGFPPSRSSHIYYVLLRPPQAAFLHARHTLLSGLHGFRRALGFTVSGFFGFALVLGMVHVLDPWQVRVGKPHVPVTHLMYPTLLGRTSIEARVSQVLQSESTVAHA